MQKKSLIMLVAMCFVLSFLPGSSFAAGPPTVTVTVDNPPDNPIPVLNVENPARSAFQAYCQATIPSNQQNVFCHIDTPEGKRVVIEYVSVLCINMASDTDTYPGVSIGIPRNIGNNATQSLNFDLFRLEPRESHKHANSKLVKFYADYTPNQKIEFNIFHTAVTEEANCAGSVSGYTVDYP